MNWIEFTVRPKVYPPPTVVRLAGFVHQCGTPVLFPEPWEDALADTVVCSGCSFNVLSSEISEPLYAPVRGEWASSDD